MGLCCLGCCSILWRWCQKKRVKESETGTVFLVLYWETQGAKWLKGFSKVWPKNLSGWEQSPDVFGLLRAQLKALCPWHQPDKTFLLYFCSSQTENSLFCSLKPPYNTWKCLTTATTHGLLPTTAPATSSPQCCFIHQPQPHLKVLCREKKNQNNHLCTHPVTLWVFRRPGVAEEGFVTDSVLILPLNVSCNWISAGNFLSSL